MIEVLSIRNVVLIDKLELELSPGLNVLTGETGAGKSVILEALGLALGERGASNVVRHGEAAAKAHILVTPPQHHPAWQQLNKDALLENLDSNDALLLSRQINAHGRSRCHVNGQMVNLGLMHDVGNLLVDIHGQYEHQSLFKPEVHLELLDAFGGLDKLRTQVNNCYHHVQELQEQIEDYDQVIQRSQRERELLEFQRLELKEAELQESEEESLSTERHILNNSENVFESATLVYNQLCGESQLESAILDGLKEVSSTTSKLGDMDGSLKGLSNRLHSALYELEDVADQIRIYRDSIEFSPRRLSEIETRLHLVHHLKRKYGRTIPEILAYQAEVENKLEQLQISSGHIEELNAQLSVSVDEAQTLARELSEKRRFTASKLESLIASELHTLGMEKAIFQVLVNPIPSPDGILVIDKQHYELRPDGMDKIEFLIAPNVGSEPKPLAKIASGGEISRVMLALKTILARIDNIPTMIYDEIDVGIGGKTADIVGDKLKNLSNLRQIICITHLPQIARLADRHFRVEKRTNSNQTFITAKQLTPEERVEEIARMHGGERTEATLAHARELLR